MTKIKVQAYWHHVAEIATDTRCQLLASNGKLVGGYVREMQKVINSFAKKSPARTDTMASIWSEGFGAMCEAGNTCNEQTKTVAEEAVDVINKAAKPVVKV